MCEQDKAFSNVYDKEYATYKAKDPMKKRVVIVDKIPKVAKDKGQMIAKEQALLRKKEKYEMQPKLLDAAIK